MIAPATMKSAFRMLLAAMTRARKLGLAARLDQGIERHDEEAAGHGEQQRGRRAHARPEERQKSRQLEERPGAGGEMAGGEIEVEDEDRHGEGSPPAHSAR